METTVSRRGQTVVLAAIQKHYNIKEGDRLAVIPLPSGDVTKALRGSGKGQHLRQKLLEERRRDCESEDRDAR